MTLHERPTPGDESWTRQRCEALDAADPLACLRARFRLPKGLIYLDGNSLGPLIDSVADRVDRTLRAEWGDGLVRSWTQAHWINLPKTVGAKIAPLIGAEPDAVIVTDSISVNLFKVLAAAIALDPGRKVILSERANFPTDLYIAEGLSAQLGAGHELRLVDSPEEIEAQLTEDVAVLMLTHVNYRSGRLHDIAALTQKAHEFGILTIWDLAHSAGAVPVDLSASCVDFAVGCGYKYLNGGPGAPAFLYVAPGLQEKFRQPLSGWMGHASPFDFEPGYQPANGVGRYLCGTPPILSLAALDAALDLWGGTSIAVVRAKSLALTSAFIELIDLRCADMGFELITPRDPSMRGSQVAIAHEHGYAIVQALVSRDVIGDFRAPDVARFGFAPLYVRFVDVWDAVDRLVEVMRSETWAQPAYQVRAAVT